jgi:hypothetical protein
MVGFIITNTSLSALGVGCWTIQLQEWIETNGGSSLLEALYKALDEVSLLFKIECQLYQEAGDFMISCGAGCKTSGMRNLQLQSRLWCRSVSRERSHVSFDISIEISASQIAAIMTWELLVSSDGLSISSSITEN